MLMISYLVIALATLRSVGDKGKHIAYARRVLEVKTEYVAGERKYSYPQPHIVGKYDNIWWLLKAVTEHMSNRMDISKELWRNSLGGMKGRCSLWGWSSEGCNPVLTMTEPPDAKCPDAVVSYVAACTSIPHTRGHYDPEEAPSAADIHPLVWLVCTVVAAYSLLHLAIQLLHVSFLLVAFLYVTVRFLVRQATDAPKLSVDALGRLDTVLATSIAYARRSCRVCARYSAVFVGGIYLVIKGVMVVHYKAFYCIRWVVARLSRLYAG